MAIAAGEKWTYRASQDSNLEFLDSSQILLYTNSATETLALKQRIDDMYP